MHVYGELTGTLTKSATLQGMLSASNRIEGQLTIPSAIVPQSYEGEYTVTPSTEEQTLNTVHLYMMDNITIEAIPSNYGLITWDGNTLTVS